MMRRYRAIAAAAAACLMFAAQPAFAAQGAMVTYNAPVITAGGGGNAQPGAAPGTGGAAGTVTVGAPGSAGAAVPGGQNVAAPGGQNAGTPGGQASAPSGQTAGVPGGQNAGTPGDQNAGTPGSQSAGAPGQPAQPQQMPVQNAGDGQTPPGDAGTTLSPVITAGGGQQAPDAAAQQAAQEAAAQQAAAEEAARQQAAAQEAAAQQAAAEAAQKAAQEAAAAEAAKQQSGGRQIDPSKPMVALTFDDGPQPSVGNRIMDCLAQYGGKATFFMVGDRVASRKSEVQRMVREGHEVANHTMNHKYLQKLGAAEIRAQVTKGNDAIEAACGVRPKLLRLPGGNHNATVVANVHMPMIQWNIDTLDWKTKNADKTVAAVLNHVKDGDIILMHELYSQSGDAALRIIPELHKRGFQMVTVSEMAAAKGKTLQAGKLYSSFK